MIEQTEKNKQSEQYEHLDCLEQSEHDHRFLQASRKRPAPSAEPSLARASNLLQRSCYAGQIMNVWVEQGEKMEADMSWFAHRCELIGLKVRVIRGIR